MNKGSITVFLTLILLCVLTLLSFVFNAAQFLIADNRGDRLLRVSVDSLLTEYDRELFRDYKMFFLPDQKNEFFTWRSKLEDYIEAGLSTSNNQLKLKSVDISKKVYASDYKNEAVKYQIYQWMQYEVGDQYLDRITDKLKLFQSGNETVQVFTKKTEEDQEKASLNRDMLRLFECVEGISTNSLGIDYSATGKLQVQQGFAKMFCPGEATASHLGVRDPIVWEVLKKHYVNPLVQIMEWSEEVDKKIAEMESKENEHHDLDWGGLPKKGIKKWIKSVEAVKRKTEDALTILEYLLDKQGEEKESTWKETLKEKAEDMLPDVLKVLQNEDENTQGDNICNIEHMKEVLEANLIILIQALRLEQVYIVKDLEEIKELKCFLDQQKSAFQNYNVKGLTFHYSSFHIKEGVTNPFHKFANNFRDSLLDILLEEGYEISKQSLDQEDARYRLFYMQEENRDERGYNIQEIVKGEDTDSVLDFFLALQNESQKGQSSHTGMDYFIKELLLNEYILIYLKGFESTRSEVEKDSKLQYEQEYIVTGKKSDPDNLAGVANKIILIRAGMNFFHILIDEDKRNITYATAAALVGFTCMEPLIRITQAALMLGWAWEEAVIDTSAMLNGYQVPFLKTKKNFQMSFEEIPIFNKKLVQQKVKSYKESDGEIGSMDYNSFLRFFLLCKDEDKVFCRLMDIIQENMKLRYRDDFNFDTCLFGMKAKAVFETNKYIFQKELEYSY